MITRDWATVDFYAVLGVAPDADADRISDAFRARAKQMHPDVVGEVGPLAERFKEVTAAYEVLSDPRRRRDYDATRRGVSAPAVTPKAGPSLRADHAEPGQAIQPAWSRRRVRAVIATGLLSVVLGVLFSVFIVVLIDREATDRAKRVPIAGTAAVGQPDTRLAYLAPGRDRPYVAVVGELAVVPGGTVTLHYVAANPLEVAYGTDLPARFDTTVEALAVTTDAGAVVVFAVGDRPYVVADPTSTRGAGLSDGAAVPLLARADDPTDVIVAEQHGARNVAFWIVAIKLIVAGPLLVWFARVRSSSSATR